MRTARPCAPALALTVTVVLALTGCNSDTPEPAPEPSVTLTAPADALTLSMINRTLGDPVADLTYATSDKTATDLCADIFDQDKVNQILGTENTFAVATGPGYTLTSPGQDTQQSRGCAWQTRPFMPADPLLVNTPEYLGADTAATIEARHVQAGEGLLCWILPEQSATGRDGTTVDGVTIDCELGPGLVYAYPEPDLAENQDQGAVARLEPITASAKTIHDQLARLEQAAHDRNTFWDDTTPASVTVDSTDMTQEPAPDEDTPTG